jgi:hypothetical protein
VGLFALWPAILGLKNSIAFEWQTPQDDEAVLGRLFYQLVGEPTAAD